MSKNYTSGLNFTWPTKGDTNWDAAVDAALAAFSSHDHSGSGKGTMLSALVNVLSLGVKNDGSVDVAPAINNIIQSYGTSGNNKGRIIYFPAGTYKLSSPIRINRQVILMGDGSNNRGTIFAPDKNVTGIIVDSTATSTDGGHGAGSKLQNLSVQYASQTTTTWTALHAYNAGDTVRGTANLNHQVVFVCTTPGNSGVVEPSWSSKIEGNTVVDGGVTWTATVIAAIRLRYPAVIDTCYTVASPGNGLHLFGSTNVGPNTNDNCSLVNFCDINTSALNGIYVEGFDANAINVFATKAGGNAYYGFYDNSSVGSNQYSGCETATNGVGAYASVSVTAPNVYSSCYSEGDQPASKIMYPSMVFGGQHGAGFTSDSSGMRQIGYAINGQPVFKQAIADATGTYFGPSNYVGAPFSWGNNSYWWSLWSNDSNFTGYDALKYENQNAYTPFCLSNASMPRGPGQVYFPRGALFPNGVDTNQALLTFSNAQPAAGTWYKGDVVINSVPTGTGSPFGWRCTTGGTPGTWVTITTT